MLVNMDSKTSFLVVVVIVCVTGTLAQQPEPKRCCVPPQFEAVMSTYSITILPSPGPVFSSVGSIIAYDSTNKRVMSDTKIPGQPEIKVIIDYKKNKQYYIYGNNCTVSPPQSPMAPMCIPDDAHFVTSFYQGTGDEKLQGNEWQYRLAGFDFTGRFSQKNCYPIMQMVRGNVGQNKMEWAATMLTDDMTLGIKDPRVFTPPSFCKGVAPELHDFHQHHPVNEYVRRIHTQL